MAKQAPIAYFFLAFYILVWYLGFLLLKPFISGIVFGIILSYMFYPVFQFIYSIIRVEVIAAIAVCFLILLILFVPLFFIGQSVATEGQELINYAQNSLVIPKETCASQPGAVCRAYSDTLSFLQTPTMSNLTTQVLPMFLNFFLESLKGLVFAIPNVLLQVFIALFLCYYLVRHGKSIVDNIEELLPMRKESRKRLAQQINHTIYGVLYGQIIVAVLQGIIATIGYFVFGIKSPIVLGILTIFFSFVPIFGTGIVWFPIVIMKFFAAFAANDSTGMVMALGLLAWCILLVAPIDNFLKPKIMSDKAKVHPALIMLGVFGGIALFGITGLILGPLILSILYELTRIYIQEREYLIE
jgi:predicted PurR-regulated permease PerM